MRQYQIKSKLHNKLGFEVFVVDENGKVVFRCFNTMLQTAYDEAEAAIGRLT